MSDTKRRSPAYEWQKSKTEAKLERYRRMHGLTTDQVAARMGVTKRVAGDWLKRAGLVSTRGDGWDCARWELKDG